MKSANSVLVVRILRGFVVKQALYRTPMPSQLRYHEAIYPITLAELGVEVAGSTVFRHSKARGVKITPVFFDDRLLTETVRLVAVIVTRVGIGLTREFLVDMI